MRKYSRYTYLLSFLLFASALVANRLSFYKMQWYADRVDHTRLVIQTFQRIEDNFKSAQIYTPSGDTGSSKAFYESYLADANSIAQDLDKLRALVGDNKSQLARVDKLKHIISAMLPRLLTKSLSESVQAGEYEHFPTILQVHQLIDQGTAEEDSLLRNRKASFLHFTRLTDLLSLGLAVIAIALIVLTSLRNARLKSKRQWLEGFLNSILDTSQNGVLYFKARKHTATVPDFVIEYSNEAIAGLFSREAHQIEGKSLLETFPFARTSGLFEKLVYVYSTGNSTAFELLYEENQTKKWLLVSLTRLAEGVTGSFHDISRIKDYEEALKEKIIQLEHSNTELEQYAYVASHDLQEPLRKIKTFGSLLRDTQSDKFDAKGKAHLEKILSASERMSVLIRDILNFSSLKKEQQYVATDLNKICEQAVEDLNLTVSQKKAEIRVEKLPVIRAIPLQMTQLFYNLINNSLKFSRAGEQPRISIQCKVINDAEKRTLKGALPNTRYFELVFKDNGIGFNQENADQIFGMFKRLTDRTSYPGSGIGLALCRKVVENHHGWISAEGVEGAGATFRVFLPETQNNEQQAVHV